MYSADAFQLEQEEKAEQAELAQALVHAPKDGAKAPTVEQLKVVTSSPAKSMKRVKGSILL